MPESSDGPSGGLKFRVDLHCRGSKHRDRGWVRDSRSEGAGYRKNCRGKSPDFSVRMVFQLIRSFGTGLRPTHLQIKERWRIRGGR